MKTKDEKAEPCIFVELELVPFVNIDLKKTELEKILNIIRMLDAKHRSLSQDDVRYENLYWYLRQFRDEMMDDHCIVRLQQGFILQLCIVLWEYRSHYHAEPWIWELSRKIQDIVGQIETSQYKS